MKSSSNLGSFIDFSSITQCSICFENYTQTNNKPMVLGCGHTICYDCLYGILGSNYAAKCPFDKKPLTRNINSYSVNYSYLDVLSQIENISFLFENDNNYFTREELKRLPKEITFSNEEGQYKGEYIKDKSKKIRHGFGEMKYKNGSVYSGFWDQNKKNGRGMIKEQDGKEYAGDWVNDLPHGKGKCTFPLGEVKSYEGGWRKGKWFGFGTITYSNGTEVEGLFKENVVCAEYIKKKEADGSVFYGEQQNEGGALKGYFVSPRGDIFSGKCEMENKKISIKPNEDCIIYYANGNKFEGQILDLQMNQKGTITYENGDKYIGEIVNGMRDGKGETKSRNGGVYNGEYKKDKREGNGRYVIGAYSYDGTWKNDKKEGTGFETLSNGETYCGDFKEGKKDGKGVYLFNNGDTYKGEWKKDKMDGKGYIVTKDGDEIVGEFQNGMMIDDVSKGKNGTKGNCVVF